MKILVACEESQAVTIAFRERGHEAYSCDIEPCSGGHPEWHIQDDVIPLLAGNYVFKTCDGEIHGVLGKWDMIIAFPPCTYLSNAGARWLYPQKGVLNQERYELGLRAKEFFMRFYNANCKKIAIENPVPSSCYNLPKSSQIIQPHNFYGKNHPYTKKTQLWLKGLPVLMDMEPVSPIAPWCPSGTGRKNKEKYGACPRGARDPVERAKTFPGIARAMAEQWG